MDEVKALTEARDSVDWDDAATAEALRAMTDAEWCAAPVTLNKAADVIDRLRGARMWCKAHHMNQEKQRSGTEAPR